MADLGYIARLVGAMIGGDENMLTKLIETKLEDMGEDALMSLLGGPMAMANEIGAAVQSGGASEFSKIRDAWLRNITPSKLPYQNMLQHIFDKARANQSRAPRGKWTSTTWAQSRQDWLVNRWMHNWISQPRDWHGRWVVGRLSQPYQSAKPKRVRGIKAKRLRRQRRRMARKLARQLLAPRNES
jgi:hypothetical protein